MLTVLVFYVDEIINKVFIIVFCWFLLAFAICKHQQWEVTKAALKILQVAEHKVSDGGFVNSSKLS